MNSSKFLVCAGLIVPLLVAVAVAPYLWADSDSDSDSDSDRDDALPYKTTTMVIELTDNDIELQSFIDANAWKKLQISAPNGREIFRVATRRILRRQGLSEMEVVSEPTRFEEFAPSDSADQTVLDFLDDFPAGDYEFEGRDVDGNELEGEATLTHVLPALPVIVEPSPEPGDENAILDIDSVVVEWEAVTTRFIGSGPIEITGYQVIVEQAEPFRKLTVNLPASATSLSIPVEFLEGGQEYDLELVAFEASGNSTISVTEFETTE